MDFNGKEDIKSDDGYPEGEEEKQWEKAVELGVKLSKLDSEEEVLTEIVKLGMNSRGEEIVAGSVLELITRNTGDEEESRKIMEGWKNDVGQNKWSFYKELYRPFEHFQLPVEKVDGFSYWPLMGMEKGTEEDRKAWEQLLTPDRTDKSLEGIFAETGESAIYQYHLVDGFRSRCKVVFQGKKYLRLRGKTRRLPCGAQLDRDPEYERDVERINSTTPDGYQKPTKEELMMIYHSMPPCDKPSILAQNEPPFIPCTNCKDVQAEFCETGKNRDWGSFENPDTRLESHSGVFCSTLCGRAWIEKTKPFKPLHECMMDLENSPRAGMCQFSNNIFIHLHMMPLHLLEQELFGLGPLIPGIGLYAGRGSRHETMGAYHDDEKPEGRHHPLWPKEKRRKYRDNKRGWQDRILGRMRILGLEAPPRMDMFKKYYD
eukprot:GFUD01042259.1.p1 GENE.GFUD01042259.1~~GFUD01042259.1.p1  ORF type:complete len:476 (-),score=154.50 GFUD01042259.1:133-1422(-)